MILQSAIVQVCIFADGDLYIHLKRAERLFVRFYTEYYMLHPYSSGVSNVT